MKIKIVTEVTGEVEAEITKERNPRTAEAITRALPLEGRANRWGDEIYFRIPVKVGEENGQVVVNIGDIGYWPPGEALCIFFGPTPVSEENEPRAYSPVNVIGKLTDDPSVFKKVKDGEKIRVMRA
jgi:hypothetical protein